MTIRVTELPLPPADRKEVFRQWRQLEIDVRQFEVRVDTPHCYYYLYDLAARAASFEQLLHGLAQYGAGGPAAYYAEMRWEDAANPAALTTAQSTRRQNRALWRTEAKRIETATMAERRFRARELEKGRWRRLLLEFPAALVARRMMVLDFRSLLMLMRGDPVGALRLRDEEGRPIADDPRFAPGDDPRLAPNEAGPLCPTIPALVRHRIVADAYGHAGVEAGDLVTQYLREYTIWPDASAPEHVCPTEKTRPTDEVPPTEDVRPIATPPTATDPVRANVDNGSVARDEGSGSDGLLGLLHSILSAPARPRSPQ